MRYIIKTEKYTPICCGENQFFNLDVEDYNYNNYYDASKQYQREMIFNVENNETSKFKKHYNGRVTSEIIGFGIILKSGVKTIKAIIVRDNSTNELVCIINRVIFPDAHLKRLLKVLKEEGINIKKNVIDIGQTESIEDMFVVDPLKPSFDDFSDNKQLELSNEFLTNLVV